MSDKCLICGEYVPEGRQVCPNCEKRIAEKTTKTKTKRRRAWLAKLIKRRRTAR